jgi:protocatechuate 3,4-dioxygenase beta subunit
MGARVTLAMLVVFTFSAACEDAPATPGPSTPVVAGCARPSEGTAADAEVMPGPINGLPASTATGQALVIEAVVLQRDCRPAAGAQVRLWHADARGVYAPPGPTECCYYGGTVTSDQLGRFRIRTIRPAEYPEPNAPPAHIHLEISHPAGDLDTEIIFGSQVPDRALVSTGRVEVALRADGEGWRGSAVFVLDGTS